MPIAELSWPEASIWIAGIVAAGVFLSVLVWSIFRTGQTAISAETGRRD